jgi:hypothetical protein
VTIHRSLKGRAFRKILHRRQGLRKGVYDRTNGQRIKRLGVVAFGPKQSLERQKHLEELRTNTQLTADTDTISSILGPGNCHPSTPQYGQWFMNMAEGTSLWLSADRYGQRLESMASAASYQHRLAKFNKEAIRYRQEQAVIHGSLEKGGG